MVEVSWLVYGDQPTSPTVRLFNQLCRMQLHPWQRYSTAPLLLKLLTWCVFVVIGFLLFHTYILQFTEFSPKPWIQELYFNLLCGLPLFLLLTGASLHDRLFRWPVLLLVGIFFVSYVLNFLNFHEVTDIYGLSFVMSSTLVLLMLVYLAKFFLREKSLSGLLKLLWLISMSYSFIAKRLIPNGGKQALYTLYLAVGILPLMMIWGMVVFFRKEIR